VLGLSKTVLIAHIATKIAMPTREIIIFKFILNLALGRAMPRQAVVAWPPHKTSPLLLDRRTLASYAVCIILAGQARTGLPGDTNHDRYNTYQITYNATAPRGRLCFNARQSTHDSLLIVGLIRY
jgi:hypothetical protein